MADNCKYNIRSFQEGKIGKNLSFVISGVSLTSSQFLCLLCSVVSLTHPKARMETQTPSPDYLKILYQVISVTHPFHGCRLNTEYRVQLFLFGHNNSIYFSQFSLLICSLNIIIIIIYPPLNWALCDWVWDCFAMVTLHLLLWVTSKLEFPWSPWLRAVA